MAAVSVAVAIGMCGGCSGCGSATMPLPRQCLPSQSNGSCALQHLRIRSSDSRRGPVGGLVGGAGLIGEQGPRKAGAEAEDVTAAANHVIGHRRLDRGVDRM